MMLRALPRATAGIAASLALQNGHVRQHSECGYHAQTLQGEIEREAAAVERAAQRGVQRLLGEENQRIIGSAMRALGEGDMPALGALMDEAQELFAHHAIPVCPSQLTAPNLHRVLRHAPLRAHIWGAKGVGSQGDGCAQLLCRSEAEPVAAMQLVERALGMVCMPLRVGAARPVRTALIPAASFSSSLYPASRSLAGGALFPILDADGILKPAVLLLVEEALEAGLERVVIVVSAAHRRDFDELFHQHPDVRELHRLPPRPELKHLFEQAFPPESGCSCDGRRYRIVQHASHSVSGARQFLDSSRRRGRTLFY